MTTKSTKIEVAVKGHKEPFFFEISKADYDEYIRETQRDVGMAAHNLVTQTSTEKERVLGIIETQWGFPLVVVGALIPKLMGVESAHAKNSSGA